MDWFWRKRLARLSIRDCFFGLTGSVCVCLTIFGSGSFGLNSDISRPMKMIKSVAGIERKVVFQQPHEHGDHCKFKEYDLDYRHAHRENAVRKNVLWAFADGMHPMNFIHQVD
jgi:hypothetical protein